MKRWPTKQLGDVAQVTAGDPAPQRPEDFAEDGVPFVRMQDVGRLGQSTCLAETKDRLSPSASARLKRFPAGSILVPKSGASIRLNHRVILGIEAHVVSHLAVIVPRPLLNTHFAYYWLCGTDLSGVAHQADLPSMKTSDLARLQLPVPPLTEQERLVKFLDEADELRKLRAQADHRTATLIPALFREMFGSPAINPFGWPVECVGTLFDVKRGGAKCGPFGSALKKHEYVESGIPVWGIPNILPNQFVEAGSLFISPSKFEELRAYAVEPDDLLFSRAGTVGRICVARPKAKNSIIGTNLIRVALDRKRIVSEFFATLMTHLGTEVGRLRANADEGSYSFMNTTVLKGLRIYLPPLQLQKEFAARVSDIRAVQAEQSASRRRLENLFQSMLHRAFIGEL